MNQEAKSGKHIYLVDTSSEIDFFTVNTPNLFHTSTARLSDLDGFHPSIVVLTTGQTPDQEMATVLQQQGWTDVSGLVLGQGGHAIIALERHY